MLKSYVRVRFLSRNDLCQNIEGASATKGFWLRAFHIGDQRSSTNRNLSSTFIKNPRDHLSQELVIVMLIVVEYPNTLIVS